MKRDPALIPLSQDHHHALALCVYTRRAFAADASEECAAAQARKIAAKFDSEIAAHFDTEEQVLFPAVGHMMRPLIDELLAEHVQLRAMAAAFRNGATRAEVEKFCEILEGHVHKEERQLFEDSQRLLTRDQLDSLSLARPPA